MSRSLVISRTKRKIRFLALVVVFLGLGSCGKEPVASQPEHDPTGEISVAIRMGKIAAAEISRAEIVVTGSGMTEARRELTINGGTITGTLRGIPVGSARLFTLNGYNTSNTLTYTGSATATVIAGQSVTVRIPVKSVSGVPAPVAVLSIISPVVANYTYSSIKGPVTISGEIGNASSKTATNVTIGFLARNGSGGPMGQTSVTLGSVPPGRKFFSARFSEDAFSSRNAPIYRIDYTINHSLGGPDSGSVSVSE